MKHELQNIISGKSQVLGMEMLSKQPPVTLEQARAQAKWLKEMSTSKKETDNSGVQIKTRKK